VVLDQNLFERFEYPILEHIRRIVEGSIVWVPGLADTVVVSLRSGNFELVVGGISPSDTSMRC